MVTLRDINSNYILLDFWFSRCGPCLKSFPHLQELYSKNQRRQLEVIAISVDQADEKQLWKATIQKYNLGWLNLIDHAASLAAKLAVVNYPTKILIDRNKKIVMVDTDNSHENFYIEVEKLIKNEKFDTP